MTWQKIVQDFNQLPCPVLVTDHKGLVQTVNANLLQLIGENAQVWVSHSMDAMFSIASRIFLQTHVWPMLLRDAQVQEIQLQMINGASEKIPVLLNCQKSTQADVDCYVWIFFITRERNRYEQALLEARQSADTANRLTASVFDAITESIMVTDANFVILSVNPAFTSLTGYLAKDAIGQNARILKSARHDVAFFAAMYDELRANKLWKGEVWCQRKDSSQYLQRLSITVMSNDAGEVIRYVGVFDDITEQWSKDQLVRHMALHDPLSGLPNRSLLMERLAQLIAMSNRESRRIALMYIDLDGFKLVNDTWGHGMGDKVLQAVSTRLVDLLRTTDAVARIGGDEFVILLDNLESRDNVATVASRIIDVVNAPMVFDENTVHVGASIGIAIFQNDGKTADALIKDADDAMYAAKLAGKNAFRFGNGVME
ncbi:MAG: diguanylate cyclase [Herminiimonas sp.]|nr:diguanylate cyclase [Herminiimonas sp.]